jgi:tetratricopeptide (TPR) repeat protein
VLGPDHPHTAQSLNNLGGLLQAMGNLAGTRPYFERAYAVREKALGSNHPDTAQSIWWLGVLAERDGDKAKAKASVLYRQALTIYENALGPEHPTSQKVRQFLGNV